MVPLYLTKPLLDDVLIPHQQSPETPINMRLVAWYLGGIAGASVLAWLLSWAQTYVLAWVSDRIGADLRNKTYAHLQSLSLEYFGGKRTGQLIQRLSTDTDRICSFISRAVERSGRRHRHVHVHGGRADSAWMPRWRSSRCCRFRSSPG